MNIRYHAEMLGIAAFIAGYCWLMWLAVPWLFQRLPAIAPIAMR